MSTRMQNNESWCRKQLLQPPYSWTSCRCSGEVLRRQPREQECHTEGTFTVSVIPFLSLWVTSVKPSLGLQWVFYPAPHFATFCSQFSTTASFVCSACRGGSSPEAEGFCGIWGLAPGLDQSALQWFLLFGVCVFPEKLLVCRLPPVLFF